MGYVILTQKKDGESIYDDVVFKSYHFPEKYIDIINKGDTFIYCQPGDSKKNGNGYFGTGIIGEIEPANNGYYFAELCSCSKFDKAVPITTGPRKYVEDLGSKNGRSRPPFEWSIRVLHKEAYDYIIKSAGIITPISGAMDEVTNTDAPKVENVKDSVTNMKKQEIDETTREPGGENILLYGVPGSGKSWTIQKEYCNDENYMERLVFHPDYMYSDFVGQIMPSVNENGDGVKYEFVPGPFTKIMKRAYENPTQMFYLVIEEINRGNAPAIFGEIFQLLDRKIANDGVYHAGTSEYGITNENIAKEMYGEEKKKQKVRIPSNLTILATMNSSDQNVFALDTAFQRRWIMRMIPNTFKGHTFANQNILDSTVTWQKFCETVNEKILGMNNSISSEDKRLGTYFITEDDLMLMKDIDTSADEIRIKHHDRRFAEKVLKYLWDDAFKYSHDQVFNTKTYKSLEEIINGFVNATGDGRFDVFSDDLKNALVGIKQASSDNNYNQE